MTLKQRTTRLKSQIKLVLKFLLILPALLAAAALQWQPVFPTPDACLTRLLESSAFDISRGILVTGFLTAASFGLFYHFFFKLRPRIRIPVALLGAFYALTSLIARSFNRYDSLEGLIGNAFQTSTFLIALASLSLFYIAILTETYRLVERRFGTHPAEGDWNGFGQTLFGRSIPASMLLIFLGWLPYLIAFYPGSMEWDYLVQIGVYDGIYLRTNMHPYFATLIMGKLLEIGRQLGSDNLGAFLYTLLQSFMLSFAFAYTVRMAGRWNVSKTAGYALVGFYALCPLWGFMAQFGIKDILYTGVLTLFGALVWEYVIGDDALRKNVFRLAAMVAVGLLACLLRNNGILIVFPSLVLLALVKGAPSARLCSVATALSVLGLYAIWLYAALPALNVAPSGARDALSIPFQQTARYVRDYGDEVTGEEAAAIANVLDYEQIGSLYMSARSDSVKGTMNGNATGDEIRAYLQAWLTMMKKHPRVYLESFLSNSYVYYCPEGTLPYLPLCEFNTEIEKNERVYLGNVDFNQFESLSDMRRALKRLYDTVKRLPILSWLVTQGIYTLFLLGLIPPLLVRGRRHLILGLVPILLVVLNCVASPVNGMMRYFLPAMASLPISLVAIGWGLAAMTNADMPEKTEN